LTGSDSVSDGFNEGFLRLIWCQIKGQKVGSGLFRWTFGQLDNKLNQILQVNGRNEVITRFQIRQLGGLLEPSGLEEGVESILTAAIDNSRTDNKHFDVFPLKGQNLIFDLLDVLVFGKGETGLVV
jgi:hypothetical protein